MDTSTAVMGSSASSPSARLQILRLQQVCRMTGLCRSLVYQLEAENRFPKRIRLTERTVGWIEAEVQHWLAERVAGSRR
jgi:prophage regulatory protein